MSRNERYCSFCGSIILLDSKFYGACGAAAEPSEQQYSPIVSQTYSPPPRSSPEIKESEALGLVSIYIGIIGCFIFPVIANIIAVILGHVSYKRGKNIHAKIGLAISYSVIGFCVLLAIILTLVFTLPYI
ncbi:MAG: hypothetical protein GNW80_00835 [Asgard group archaeon]|nr:hypothetical protein [Asgard group archaeon]